MKLSIEKSLKEKHDFLYEGDSIAIQQVRLDLETAYRNYFESQKKPNYLKYTEKTKRRVVFAKRNFRMTDIQNHPQFKSKRSSKQSFRTLNQGGTIRIENQEDKVFVRLPKLGFNRSLAQEVCRFLVYK